MNIHTTPAKSRFRPLVLAFFSLVGASLAADTPPGSKTVTPAIKLDQKWDNAMKEGVTVMAEIKDALANFGQAAANVSAPPGEPIYKNVTYLMPLLEARKALGLTQRVNSRLLVITPGFPNRSIYAYSFNGNFDGFETMYIATDVLEQVVAVELVTVHVKKTNLTPYSSKKEWRTYDFINGSTKAIGNSEVRREVVKSKETGAIQVDSVLMLPTNSNSYPRNYYFDLEPRSGTRLFLPKTFAELMLYRISKCGV